MEKQKVPEEVVYEATFQALSSDAKGELETLLQDMIQWEREHPPQTQYDGFEWYMVHGDARTLNSLVTKKILEIRMKTNKTCNYRLSNINAVERAICDYQGMISPQEETAEIPPDLFDIVIGHDDKKDIILRSIASDRPVPCLLHGSPASAKTLMLQELARLPGSKFILGSNLSKAGLFEVLFNERPKYLILDELDKVDDEDNLSALLSLTERGGHNGDEVQALQDGKVEDVGLRLRQSYRQAASRAPEQVHQAQVQGLHGRRVPRGRGQGADVEGGRGRIPRGIPRRQDHEGPEQQGREGPRQDS